MKATIETKALNAAVAACSKVAKARSNNELHKHVALWFSDAVSVQATSGEQSLDVVIPPARAHVVKPGACLVRADILRQCIGAVSEPTVEIERDAKGVHIGDKRVRYLAPELKQAPADMLDIGKKYEELQIGSFVLGRAMRMGTAAIGVNNSQASNGSMLLQIRDGHLWFVSTDGNHLALAKIEIGGDDAATARMIPQASALMALQLVDAADASGAEDCILKIGPNSVAFVCGDSTLTTVLGAGTFSPYEGVLAVEKPAFTVGFKSSELVAGMQAVNLRESEHGTFGVFQSGDGVEFRAGNLAAEGEARVLVPAKVQGKFEPFGIRISHVQHIVSAIGSDDVTMALTTVSGKKPAVLHGSSEGEMGMFVPVQMDYCWKAV